MSPLLYFGMIAGGLLLAIVGANWLVDGASSIAKKLNISELVIGLTIVAFGTSAPELIVSTLSTIEGNPDIAIGNVVGSNIFNVFVILGLAAMVYPITIKSSTVWKEIPLSLLAALVLLVSVNDFYFDGTSVSSLNRIDGFIHLGFFIVFLYYSFYSARSKNDPEQTNTTEVTPTRSLPKSSVMVLAGLVGLFFGGKFLVEGAIQVAKLFEVDDSIIALTIVAAGTSVPELATSVVAAYKRNSDIAIGNVVGSNIFNIFLILGVSALIHPLPFNTVMNVDIFMVVLSSVMMLIFTFIGTARRITRLEGAILFLIYVVYVIYLLKVRV
jgi:cation:H+ antiporter